MSKPSFRKAVTGKRVKIMSHASPSLIGHVGIVDDVVKGGNVKVLLSDNRIVTVDARGLRLADKVK